MRKLAISQIIFTSVMASCACSALAAPTYSLYGVGGFYSTVEGLNDVGQAVGVDMSIAGFIWDLNGGIRSLGIDGAVGTDSLGRTFTVEFAKAYDINNQGVVTGYVYGNLDSFQDNDMPLVWRSPSDFTIMTLRTPPGNWEGGVGLAINEAGLIAGHGQRNLGGLSHDPFVWNSGSEVTALGQNAYWSQANAINESGVVVGFDQIPSFIKAYTWSEATGKVFLGTDQGGEGYANGINDVGEVVGSLKYYTDPSGTDLIATLWRSATDWIRLGDFTGGAEQSEALDINNAGQIVGWGTAEAGKEAFYWDELSGLVSLASLVDESLKGWKLLQANTINNLGWIGGQGINPQGGVEGFILIPKQAIPEPGTLTLLGLGLAGIGVMRRRTTNKAVRKAA